MVHLRIVTPGYETQHVLDLLNATPSVYNVIFLPRRLTSPRAMSSFATSPVKRSA